MNLDDLKKEAGNPDNIVGIYNYCDRWCERCSFTSRCLSYKNESRRVKELMALKHTDDENEIYWDVIHENFEMAKELIREFAESVGIEIDKLPEDIESIENEKRINRIVKKHLLISSADKYLNIVTKWFDGSESLFIIDYDEKSKSLLVNLTGQYTHLDTGMVTDAIEVIKWYQYQISVKLSRALHGKELLKQNEDDKIAEFETKDMNGSAKVALIGIDRSIGAWNVLLSSFPKEQDAVLEILVCLSRLRNAVEKEFPDARNFIRPGFDE